MSIEQVTPPCPRPDLKPADCRCIRCKVQMALYLLKREAREKAARGAAVEELVFMACEAPTGLTVLAEPLAVIGPVVGEAFELLCGTPEPGFVRYAIVLAECMTTGTVSLRERVEA